MVEVKKQLKGDPETTTDWYKICCDITLSNLGAGVVDGGAVSSSGFGDGSYDCYAHRDEAGELVFAEIIFVTEEDDE